MHLYLRQDIFAEPSEVVAAIDREVKHRQMIHDQHAAFSSGSDASDTLHMWAKVDGARVGQELFSQSYQLPDNRHAYAYMPSGPRQRPVSESLSSDTNSEHSTPELLVQRIPPSNPSEPKVDASFPEKITNTHELKVLPPKPTAGSDVGSSALDSVQITKLLLPTIKGHAPGTLRDPALDLQCELVPRDRGNASDGERPTLPCGACDNNIFRTVLIRKTKNGSKFYHKSCVCNSCDDPLDKLRVPWANQTQFYHPDCCCQFCYKPIFEGEEETEEIVASDPKYRYYPKPYRFHSRCPKIKSPPFNATICASCKREIRQEKIVRTGADEKKYHSWCMTPQFVFKPRLREAESNAYYDHEAHTKRIFSVDWKKCLKRKSLHGLLTDCKTDARKLKKCIAPFYERICDIYDMYSGFGRFNASDADDAFELQQAEVKQWASDADLFSGGFTWNRCYTFFLAANVEIDTEIVIADEDDEDDDYEGDAAATYGDVADDEGIDADDAVNDDSSLVRFEFVLFLIMCAHGRYFSQSSNDLVSAVSKCLTNHLANIKLPAIYENLPQLDPDDMHPCVHRPNDFRYTCLYHRGVQEVLQKHIRFLQSVFVCYSRFSGRKNSLKIDRWFEFTRDALLIDQDSSERDILLCFCFSRMRVKDEMVKRERVTELTFVGFLESLVRIAFAKNIDLFALLIADVMELSTLPKGATPPQKWLEKGFMREADASNDPDVWGPSIQAIAQRGELGFYPQHGGYRVDILIEGIKYIFQVHKDWNLRSKFPPVNNKQLRVLESRDGKSPKHDPAGPTMTTMQLWEPETGHAIFRPEETGHVAGISVHKSAGKVITNMFGSTRSEHHGAKSGKGRKGSLMLHKLKKKKK